MKIQPIGRGAHSLLAMMALVVSTHEASAASLAIQKGSFETASLATSLPPNALGATEAQVYVDFLEVQQLATGSGPVDIVAATLDVTLFQFSPAYDFIFSYSVSVSSSVPIARWQPPLRGARLQLTGLSGLKCSWSACEPVTMDIDLLWTGTGDASRQRATTHWVDPSPPRWQIRDFFTGFFLDRAASVSGTITVCGVPVPVSTDQGDLYRASSHEVTDFR